MDSRIVYSVADGRYQFNGRCFDNLGDLEAYGNALISRREKLAGRTLTPSELINGVNHKEDRDTGRQISDKYWKPVPVQDQPADDATNPWRARLAEQQKKDRLAKMSPRSQMLAQMADDHDAKQVAEAERVAFESEPRRQKAIANAEAILEKVLFDASQPMSAVIKAKQRLRQAREGDLATYKTLAHEFIARQDDAKAARLEELDQQLAELRQQRVELGGDKFEDEPPQTEPNVYYPPSYDLDRVREFGQEYRDAARKQNDGTA